MIIGSAPTMAAAQAATLAAVSLVLAPVAQPTTTGVVTATMPEQTNWTMVAQPSTQETEEAWEPKLILLTQNQNVNEAGAGIFLNPSYIASKMATVATLPFDGIAIHSSSGYSTLMDGSLHSVASLAAEWAPLDGAAWASYQTHNFAVVNVRRPADFFDSWTNTIQSFQNLATVLADIGIQGIMFDNEEYSVNMWDYPSAMSYAGTKTLQQYHDQAQLRAEQIMTATQAVYPDIQWMVLLSPNENCATTPSLVRGWSPQTSNVRGAFTVGLMTQANNPVIDGNEVGYAYRTQTEFDAAYTWNKTDIASAGAACPFIPTGFRSSYPNQVSISEPIYNQSISYATAPNPRVMNISVYPTILEMSMLSVEQWAWLYWEGGNWYHTPGSTYGVPTAWYDATETVWLATRAPALRESVPPGKRKGQRRKP